MNIKKILVLFLFTASALYCQTQTSEISSLPGAFSRMGFGARGMGMGNAMSSITEGNMISYYNPALSVFQTGNSLQSSYSILSMDRTQNFLGFTKRFVLREKSEGRSEQAAGISIGIINAGVSDIDERSTEGYKTGDISTSENQIFVALANKFSEKLALGLNIKFFYYDLYENITSSAVGFDFGAVYLLNDNINISLSVHDINSKYEWDTNEIYGQNGNNTVDEFPLLKKIGVSYKLENPNLIASVEFESSDAETNFIRFGAEYNIHEGFYLRGGVDKINLSNSDFPARPSMGFSYLYNLDTWFVGIDYAFVIEPYSTSDRHIIGINVNF